MSKMYEFTVKIAVIADNENIAKSYIEDDLDNIRSMSDSFIQDYYITDNFVQMELDLE